MSDKNGSESQHNEDVNEKNNVLYSEVLENPDLLLGAFDAENREHEQGLWVSCGRDDGGCHLD